METASCGPRQLLDHAEELLSAGKHEEARLICQQVLSREADYLEALYLLGAVHAAEKNWDEAARCYEQASTRFPELTLLKTNLGVVLMEAGRFDEALVALDQAAQAEPDSLQVHYNRGVLLQRMERSDEARAAFEQGLALDPTHLGSWVNLSAACLVLHDADAVLHCCHHGLYLEPHNPPLLANLAAGYTMLFRFEEAIRWNRRLLELVTGEERAEALGRIANALADCGKVDEALVVFDQAIACSESLQQKQALASTRLFVLHYSPNWSAKAIAAEHRAWGETFFPAVAPRSFFNDPDPDRPIRVAYLSPDFKIHAVVFFLQPVLAAHDPARVTVYCYADVKKPDLVTNQLREQHNVIWRDVSRLDDDAVERLLQEDRIDILVDLAGHTAGNRLPLFARRAAPLQVTWIGYPNGTGLKQMDYRITDAWADPASVTDCYHTETLLRMPDCFLCYRPGADFPEPAPSPCRANGYITFGSFSNFKKVTSGQLDLWASILAAVPDSRLVFRARGITETDFQRDIAPIFKARDVDPVRVTVLGHARSVVDNLNDYSQIDIALDTFPYHGTTTTCEALCMGVPVVTMAGDSHVSRVGVSLLNTVGFAGLVAGSADHYRELAVELAGEPQRLQEIRSALRERLLGSSLSDNAGFTHNLEQLYRRIWLRWCHQHRD